MSSVKEKIRKLLNLAADRAASEHEIESCLAKAERLIQAYHLGESDLFDDSDEHRDSLLNVRFTKRVVHAARKCYEWERCLAGFVQKYVGGIGYYSDSGGGARDDELLDRDGNGTAGFASIQIFYGLEDDVELADALFSELRPAIMHLAIEKHNGCFRGPGASYAQGFVAGKREGVRNRFQKNFVWRIRLSR